MTEKLSTSHNGYDITFDFFTEEWGCAALGICHAKISEVKKKINAWELQARRVPNIPALLLRYHSAPLPVSIVTIEQDGSAVWVKYGGSNCSKERSKEKLRDLMHNVPAVTEALAKAFALQKQASELTAQAEKIRAEIPRITLEELRTVAGNALDEVVANG